MMGAIYLLVLAMGLRLGMDRQVTSGLKVIGLQALVITILTIFGSMLAIFFARKLLKMDRHGMIRSTDPARSSANTSETKSESDHLSAETASQSERSDTDDSAADLKSTAIIVGLVILGIFIGKVVIADHLPQYLDRFSIFAGNALTVVLCVLILIIGFDMGISGTVVNNLKQTGIRVLAFPLAIIIGTLVMGIAGGMAFGFSFKESAAIAAGFGWYSYAPAVIAAAGPQYAVASAVSFLHNVIRETAGIILLPIFAKKIGYLEPLGIPGSGTMDVCMPMVERICGQDVAAYGFISGFLLCVFTSAGVPLFMGL